MTIKLKKYLLEATIPTQQYGNIRPHMEFEVASEEELKEAYEFGVSHLVQVSKDVGETSMTRKEVKN